MTAALRASLLSWYDANARDLPWRRTRDPYAIWVAEVMLQQTRVETVVPYYARFLGRFPDACALADAPLDEVLAAFSGLGYYRRARLLHRGAAHVRDEHSGELPRDPVAIRRIPGVGAYTAGAIASQSFDLPEAVVDGNVARVLARIHLIATDVKKGPGLVRTWALARELVLGERPGALNNALMELGATICVPREPRCAICPVALHCGARAAGRERVLPVVSDRPARPAVRELAAVLAVADDKTDARVFVRRVRDGLFGGMWEPPRIATRNRATAERELATALGVDVRLDRRRARVVEHVLTHRQLHVSVVTGVVDRAPVAVSSASWDGVEVVSSAALRDRGVSTLARKVLKAASH